MKKKLSRFPIAFAVLVAMISICGIVTADDLESNFKNPPREVGGRCWWWWLNGNVTKEAITKDLEAMHEKGFSGAVIIDANGADQRKNKKVPVGPRFSGPEWTELYLHALNEAKRLDLKLGLSIQSGWNLGGPFVSLDDVAKQITYSETQLEGPARVDRKLPRPKSNYKYYRDICVLAYPEKEGSRQRPGAKRKPIRDLKSKTAARELGRSAPDGRPLLEDHPSVEGEEDVSLKDIVDITEQVGKDGTLRWNVPPGKWTALRFGYTPTRAKVSTSSDNWQGHVIDYLSKASFDNYWHKTVEPLLEKAGPLAGTVLTQLATDSWECGGMNWSPGFAEDFKRHNGYDLRKYLPVVAGKIVENREFSNAFLADFRKTIGRCISENHYKVFAEHATRYHLGIQPESAGPHAGPLDGITNYSHSSIVMSEFWAPSPHRPEAWNRFFVKQAASAAHIYGKRFVGAEAFTTIGPHWNDTLWRSQKPSMDYEFCEGLNMIFFHTFTCSPKTMGIPGQEYFAGTHINPQVTWWNYSDAYLDYMNRIQAVVQQGRFVADVLYYYGDHVPNIAVNKGFNRAGALPGYDFDVTNEEVLLRLKVSDGKIVVPGGIRYRLLVLPDHQVLSSAALEKVEQLLQQGATVLGPKPQRLVSLVGGPSAQRQFHDLADHLWGVNPPKSGQKKVGAGRLAWGLTSRELLQNDGVAFDFEVLNAEKSSDYDYIHYTIDEADVYFVCNQTDHTKSIRCVFRVEGKQPELWDPVTGEMKMATAFKQTGGRTIVPVVLDPYGSCLVVFRKSIPNTQQGTARSNYPQRDIVQKVLGPWHVTFDPAWGGPESAVFEKLTDWTKHADQRIRHYSGKATYSSHFDIQPIAGKRYWLRLNRVEDVGIAAVKLNGKKLGITWTKPFRIEMTEALVPGRNQLEITVVNSWQNRLVGDRDKPQSQRYTKTNISIDKNQKILSSGLLGPVEITTEAQP
ncbi:MAG: glycosyl hydrolase [Planctomycetia bacterium]|jgi:hypothetical protein